MNVEDINYNLVKKDTESIITSMDTSVNDVKPNNSEMDHSSTASNSKIKTEQRIFLDLPKGIKLNKAYVAKVELVALNFEEIHNRLKFIDKLLELMENSHAAASFTSFESIHMEMFQVRIDIAMLIDNYCLVRK
ncbi:hypothetical protein ACLKA7_007382 [Drosophila subpalustris]